MQKKSSGQKSKNLRLEIESKSKFWQPVVRNGWWIKFSVYRDHFILLMIVSRYTGQTIIRYYTNEEEAVAFINFITTCNAQDTFESA
jgi:ABC-type molybdate transport system substrate-binding protein